MSRSAEAVDGMLREGGRCGISLVGRSGEVFKRFAIF